MEAKFWRFRETCRYARISKAIVVDAVSISSLLIRRIGPPRGLRPVRGQSIGKLYFDGACTPCKVCFAFLFICAEKAQWEAGTCTRYLLALAQFEITADVEMISLLVFTVGHCNNIDVVRCGPSLKLSERLLLFLPVYEDSWHIYDLSTTMACPASASFPVSMIQNRDRGGIEALRRWDSVPSGYFLAVQNLVMDLQTDTGEKFTESV